MLYHELREAHLDSVHRWLMAVVILSGSAAVVGISGNPAAFSFVSVLAGTFDLVFDLTNRARDHRQHRLEVKEYLSELLAASEKDIPSIEKKALQLRLSAPPTYRAVRALSWNEAFEALTGETKGKISLHWWERATAHWWKHRGATEFKFAPPKASSH